jgi:hypothetical protein
VWAHEPAEKVAGHIARIVSERIGTRRKSCAPQ